MLDNLLQQIISCVSYFQSCLMVGMKDTCKLYQTLRDVPMGLPVSLKGMATKGHFIHTLSIVRLCLEVLDDSIQLDENR